MRIREERVKIAEAKVKSLLGIPTTYKTPKGEYFMFENGRLEEYTDTRVIDHETDRLVDLSTSPYID